MCTLKKQAMDHKEAVDRNIAELYLKQELSQDDEAAFEEHLLYCEKCRENLKMLDTAYETIQRFQADRLRGIRAGGSSRRVLNITVKFSFRIAAVIILLLGLAGVITILLHRERTPKWFPATPVTSVDSINDTITIYEINKKMSAPGREGNKVAELPGRYVENFVPNPFYENIIQNNMRDNGFRVVSPVKDTLTSLPVFEWNDKEISQLILVVFNNKEAEIFKGQIVNKSRAGMKIKPGLYYWQLQNNDEVLITGRFIYIPVDDQ